MVGDVAIPSLGLGARGSGETAMTMDETSFCTKDKQYTRYEKHEQHEEHNSTGGGAEGQGTRDFDRRW